MDLKELELSSGSSEKSSKKLYTGLASIQIKLVNPNQKQLAEFFGTDIESIKEPVYKKDADSPTRIDFWYTNHPDFSTELKGKFSIFIRNEARISKSDKKQYIDSFSKTAWAMNLSDLSSNQQNVKDFLRVDMNSVREAMIGEETIYELLKAYGNIMPRTKPLELSDWKGLVKGSGKELQEFFTFFNNNDGGMTVMLGVKDYKYQDVYTGRFMRLNSKISDYDKKNIEGDYGFKSFYDGYVLSEYLPEEAPDEMEIDDNPFMDDSDSSDSSNADSPMIQSSTNLF